MMFEDVFELSNTATATEITNFVTEHRPKIYQAWIESIRRSTTFNGEHIINTLQKEFESNTDLLTIFGYTLTGQIHAETSRLRGLVEKVRTKEYSVLELFYEIFSLQDALEETFVELGSPGNADITANLNMTRRVLGRIFSATLEQTSWIYELVTESGKRGFCQMDRDGHIIYSNAEMDRIFDGCNLKGERLDRLFPESFRQYIRAAISSKSGERLCGRELDYLNLKGEKTTVWAEIEPITYAYEQIGAYAMLTDISPVARRESDLFDASPWCVVKVDSRGKFVYANKEAMSFLRINSCLDHEITDFAKGNNLKIITNAIKRRQRGEKDAYKVSLIPMGCNKPVEVDICGVPVTDAEGNSVGSVAIFHDRKIVNVSKAIHEKISDEYDTKEMLKAVAEILNELIPFDLCIVTRYSEQDDHKLTHANPFFTYSPGSDFCWTKKWTPLSEPMIRWLSAKIIEPYILDTFLQLDEWKDLEDDHDVQTLITAGYKSFIFKVIGNNDQLKASFSLLSKDEQAFSDHSCQLLEELPLDKAMEMALHQHERSEMEFRYALVKSIARASSLDEAARVFVKSLRVHYDLLLVSLFRVERFHGRFTLQAQDGSGNSMRLPDNYSQSINEGLLAECITKNEIVNEGDTASNSRFKSSIVDSNGDSIIHSEMCCPIKANDEVRWVLNIEDTLISAFSQQEERAVSQACEEFGVLVERLSSHLTFQACFDSTTDLVVITDEADNIIRANPSAESILGHGDSSKLDGHFGDFFTSEKEAGDLLSRSRSAPIEVTLQNPEECASATEMLMSCCMLPKVFGEKVYISKDLTGLKRLEQLEYQSTLTYEVAAQSQSPLSLAFTWLRKLRDNPEEFADKAEIGETANKIMRQLRKVQATYDRMAFYQDDKNGEHRAWIPEYPIRLNLLVEIERMLNAFPASDSDLVAVPVSQSVPSIMADPVHISLILEALFSYLLRYASVDRQINIQIAETDNLRLRLRIDGCEPIDEVHDIFLMRMRTDIAIGTPMLVSLVEAQQGYFETYSEKGRAYFVLEFPVFGGMES
ncbi:MAG: PAS domain-containing protein [Halopseudomonas sp.]